MEHVDDPSRSKTVAVFRLELFRRSETFILAQARALTRYAPLFVGRTLGGAAPDAVTYERVLASPISFAVALLAGRDSGPRLPVDLVHAHFATDAAAALAVAHRARAPLVVTLHGFDITTGRRSALKARNWTALLAHLRRSSLKARASLFICVSEHIRRVALAKGFPADRLLVHRVGVDTFRLTPRASHGPDLVVHTARLVEKKGTAVLVRAFAEVSRRRPQARLVVIGGGPLMASLTALRDELGLQDVVHFRGERPHRTALGWMRRAAVVCVPSVTAANGDTEGLPTVLFEAGAVGAPVVATLNSGIPEAIEDGANGLLVPERDVAALADALVRVLSDSALREQLSVQARRRAVAQFDVRRQTGELEAIYDEVLRAWAATSGSPDRRGAAPSADTNREIGS